MQPVQKFQFFSKESCLQILFIQLTLVSSEWGMAAFVGYSIPLSNIQINFKSWSKDLGQITRDSP
jgi:hypothetical protein